MFPLVCGPCLGPAIGYATGVPRTKSGKARTYWHRFTLSDAEHQLLQAALAAQQIERQGLRLMGYLREIVMERAERDAAGARHALQRYAESRQTDVGALIARAIQDPTVQAALAPILAQILTLPPPPKKG